MFNIIIYIGYLFIYSFLLFWGILTVPVLTVSDYYLLSLLLISDTGNLINVLYLIGALESFIIISWSVHDVALIV